MARNIDTLDVDELENLVARVIANFPFWDYGCEDFPATDGDEPSECAWDLAEYIVERLT